MTQVPKAEAAILSSFFHSTACVAQMSSTVQDTFLAKEETLEQLRQRTVAQVWVNTSD